MKTFLSRWSRPRRKASHLEVTVYTRAHCCCCHKALDLLKEYQTQHEFTINTVDIDSDLELARRYDTEVPVVAVDGKVRFKGVVNPVLFERLLEAEGRED
jgi:predicted thioredoxin/glutaredoxin